MPEFIPGIELNRRFYFEAVRPILAKDFPNLTHAAATIGPGSEVLGFDTPMSTDHDWGPRVVLFLQEPDLGLAEHIRETMSQDLPYTFYGYSVNFEQHPDELHTRVIKPISEGPIKHRVFITTVRDFFQQHLAYEIDQPLKAADWLTIPAQKLREVTAGAVYYDGSGHLTKLRQRFAYYPQEVWLYLLAAGWRRIGQEGPLMSRAGFVGDEIGSAVIGARLVRDIMNLAFLLEKQYAPYPKWFGTAFQQLKSAAELSPLLRRVQLAPDWQEREAALIPAYEYLARTHNSLGITKKMPETVSDFHNRPFKVIQAETFAQAILAQINDPEVKRIAALPLIGSIDQFSDSTDLRYSSLSARLKNLYK